MISFLANNTLSRPKPSDYMTYPYSLHKRVPSLPPELYDQNQLSLFSLFSS